MEGEELSSFGAPLQRCTQSWQGQMRHKLGTRGRTGHRATQAQHKQTRTNTNTNQQQQDGFKPSAHINTDFYGL